MFKRKIQSVFKISNADKTIKAVFVNGLKQVNKGDFELRKDSIKVYPGLAKGETLTLVQETNIKV